MNEPPARGAALAVQGLSKSFAGVTALHDVTLSFPRAEITAVAGNNGAGKSTLIKCLSGLQSPDAGHILVDDRPVHLSSPRSARELGIETVYQDLGLIDDMRVWENLFLSREIRRSVLKGGLVNKRAMRTQACQMLAQIGAESRIRIEGEVRWMSGGQRQAIAIARAVAWGARVVILDEPTAALGVRERAEVHDLILRLKSQGITVICISHNFEEIMAIADQIWVMNRGTVVGSRRVAQTTAAEVVAMLSEAPAGNG